MARKKRLEGIFEALEKNELSEGDYKILAQMGREFKESQFYPLFLAITGRERRKLELNRSVMISTRPDFLLGMIHENAVIENSPDALEAEYMALVEEKKKARDMDKQLEQRKQSDISLDDIPAL